MRARRLFICLLLACGIAAPALHAAAGSLVRVPQDARTLDAAISRVADGGVIEMSAGTYATPGNGFLINNPRKGFTVRAAAGATVALDGGGTGHLLRYINSDRARGKLVTFERIVFQNGFSDDSSESGGVTLSKSEALFRSCSFVNNRAAALMTGGGAVKVLEGSAATFINCSFRGNSSQLRGGAISVRSAVATVQGGEFVGNRTNLAGHNPISFGGAIFMVDGTLRVSGARFEGNEAGLVGGAIYAIGNWTKGSDVLVTDSTFTANQAVADPCCVSPLTTSGGAIHAEDLTTVRVHRSLFQRNRADAGSAVSSYRAVVEIYGSVFQANQPTLARPEGAAEGTGGAVAAQSADFPDASTDFGAINRRSARVVIAQSLLQGGSEIARVPHGGGCVLVGGDAPRVYGGAVAPTGTLEENRAKVEIRGVVFSDCDIQTASNNTSGGLGGAVGGDLIDLVMEDSMILDSDARGATGSGGGIALRTESNARIVRTTFARNSADQRGGALFVNGSIVQVNDCRFYGNDVVPGLFVESLNDSRGAAIFSMANTNTNPQRDVSGVVSNSSFSENPGLPVRDAEPIGSGPINDVRYNANRFNPIVFGELVYVHNVAAPSGADVNTLNFLTVNRAGGPSTKKSDVPNIRVFSPREGSLRAVPSSNCVGAGAPNRTASLLAYAWTGGGAQINGQSLPGKAGFLEVPQGDYALVVDGSLAALSKALGGCTAGPFLCLNGNRFRAEVTFKAGATTSSAQAVSLSGDTGFFWFFDPSNVELMVKVLDGRAANGRFWVFFGGLTNLAYTLTITDTVTGTVKTYTNPAGKFASVGDTSAFPGTAGAAQASLAADAIDEPAANDLEPVSAEASTCASNDAHLCLSGTRIQVELNWKDFAGKTGIGHAVQLTGDTGYFWFTSQDNVEVIVKVLDARPVNGHFWVFYGALTNLEYTIKVNDVETGRTKSYFNPLRKFGSQGDTSAIAGD